MRTSHRSPVAPCLTAPVEKPAVVLCGISELARRLGRTHTSTKTTLAHRGITPAFTMVSGQRTDELYDLRAALTILNQPVVTA